MKPQGKGFKRPFGGDQQRRDAPRSWQTRFPLPCDVAQLLKSERGKCDNLGLWLDRLVDWTDQDERGRDVELQQTMATKKRQAANVVMDRQKVKTLVEACWQRTQQELATLKRRGYHVPQPLILGPDYRLVIGFGAEHVLETNLCLHRIHGFPIIPGSAVKGVTRAWAFWQIAEQLGVSAMDTEEAERRKQAKKKTPLQRLDQLLSDGTREAQEITLRYLKADPLCANVTALLALDVNQWQTSACDFYKVFGTTDQQGQVIFFDAYPTQAPKLETDILNPHYMPYYADSRKQTPPADYHDPSPTYFLTVAKESSFQFAVASKDPALAEKAKEWLGRALTDLGIGGKTAAGYGFMKVKT